jgi:hypothetical protein
VVIFTGLVFCHLGASRTDLILNPAVETPPEEADSYVIPKSTRDDIVGHNSAKELNSVEVSI